MDAAAVGTGSLWRRSARDRVVAGISEARPGMGLGWGTAAADGAAWTGAGIPDVEQERSTGPAARMTWM